MYLKQFAKKINLILITHGFGKQTQFIESFTGWTFKNYSISNKLQRLFFKSN